MSKHKASHYFKEIRYELDDVIEVLLSSKNPKLTEARSVRSSFLDIFLFSGRFNSVLGLDGFKRFKHELKDVVKRVNADDFGLNYINLDTMYQVLMRSGIYYTDNHQPDELQKISTNKRILTAFRYVAKNLPELTYKEFREIVKRLGESNGHSFYISSNDSDGLRNLTSNYKLFEAKNDARATLMQLSQKQLKDICDIIGAKAARSSSETVARILAVPGVNPFNLLPIQSLNQKTMFIRDQELATGLDIIELDSYLRSIAKLVREDLGVFINRQRHPRIIA